jgi:F-type H+-transporting ATPase subunit c
MAGQEITTLVNAMTFMGAGIAMGFGAVGAGAGEGLTAALAVKGMARQPEVGGRISGIMLLGQAVDTSPSVFGFIIALLLIIQPQEIDSLPRAAALLGAGVAMSIGTLGSGLAIGWIASRACTFVGYRPAVAGLVTRTMLLGGAIAETLGIFSFVVALLLLSTT